MIIPIPLLLLFSFQISSVYGAQLRTEGKDKPKDKPKPKPKAKPPPTPLSIPDDDVDPDSRNTRLNERARNWQTRKYSETDSYLDMTSLINQARKTSYTATYPSDDFPFVTPTGLLGSSAVGQETLSVAMEQLELMGQNFDMDYPAVYATTMAQGGFPTFGSFASAYHALPERNVPATADFYDSDVAFAARRLTVSPLDIKKVTNENQIPFDKSTIVGLDEIIAPNNFADLISSGKLFMVDLTAYGITSADGAVNTAVEAPIGLFFVSSSGRLMPLAIKFTIQNTLTYSPKDSHADWFLAKAVFNMMDSSIVALVHFVDVHFVVSHVCQAAQQSLASEHPLYALLMPSCTKNDGIIQNGLPSLLSDGGAFDSLLAISGSAIRNKLLPNLANAYDWSQKGITEDLAARGVLNIPNFDYASDATTLNEIISTYVTSFVSSYYKSDKRVAADTELANFISKLSSSDSPLKMNGFPSTVSTVSALSAIVTRVIFLSGVQHHALNSFTISDYFLIYPHSPGKIPFVPPAKGAITDTVLKDSILMFGLDLPTFFPFFLGTLKFSYYFIPAMQATQRLDNAFYVPTSDGKVDAFAQMRSSLSDLSWTIQSRAEDDASEGLVPPFTTLDPVNLPFGSTI